LYVGIAALLHSALFLIPGVAPAKKEAVTTQRGVRVRAFVERPVLPPPPAVVPASASVPARFAPPPIATANLPYSIPGASKAGVVNPAGGGGNPGGGAPATGVTTSGPGGPAPAPSVARPGPSEPSKFANFLAGLQSSGIRGAARDAAEKNQRAYKGTGSGTGNEGWGSGSGGRGGGTGGGSGTGSGTGSGSGSGRGSAGYMDPRVKMVVTSYPSTDIERHYTQVPYPNLKIKQSKFTAGWMNVYLKLRTNSEGAIVSTEVLRPETEGVLEKQFLDQVKREVSKWDFDPKEAEIHVDVRFYVE
jgi:hypothetical protein